MQTKILDTQEAGNKFWAFQDARMRSIVNASLYTDNQKTRAERMKLGLELVYYGKSFYIAYGKRGISIKIDRAQVRDNKNLALLDADYSAEGIVKKVSSQGIIYNIPKVVLH